jgi:hypothetical protein
MAECKILTREMLRNPVDIRLKDENLTFPQARKLAERRARELAPVPMLLAWYDRRTGRYSPDVPCCREDKPAWLSYAESRGGDLIIDINDEEYVFVYRRD